MSWSIGTRIVMAFEVFQEGYWPCLDEEGIDRQLEEDVNWLKERYKTLRKRSMTFGAAARQAKADFIDTFFRLTPVAGDAASPPRA